MEKNVGHTDRMLRAVIGPSLTLIGYSRWGGKDRRWPGLFAMAVGMLISETARTRSCPINELLGIDTT